MFSEAGKLYEKRRSIQPLEKSKREKNYKISAMKVDKKIGESKFSPFNTISRQSRTSYLLRVTKEPNPQTNYNSKYETILKDFPKSTIDRAQFKRIIGDVKDEDYSISLDTIDSKCLKSVEMTDPRPLTVRESHNWRKTLQHFDFKKQQKSKRLSFPKKMSMEESTNANFMTSLTNITESNFNNYDRFALKSKPTKAHNFNSDKGHQYLREIQIREKSPEYNILTNDESIIRKALSKTKGEKRFYLYKNQIRTRLDREDPEWKTQLEYDADQKPKIKNIVGFFDDMTNRQENSIHSKYPIRLSLSKILSVPE